jgi:hypothetical protein
MPPDSLAVGLTGLADHRSWNQNFALVAPGRRLHSFPPGRGRAALGTQRASECDTEHPHSYPALGTAFTFSSPHPSQP